jgi:leucyl aminopeptidase
MLIAVDHLEQREAADLLVLPFFQGSKEAISVEPVKEFTLLFEHAIKAGDFLGKEGELTLVYPEKEAKEKRILALGLGEKNKLTPERCRRAYALMVKICQKKKYSRVNLSIPKALSSFSEAICEGVLLTNYGFFQFKKKKDILLQKICFIGLRQGSLKRTQAIIDAVSLTKDLVNGNADEVTADALVKTAGELCKKQKVIKKRILRKKELEKEKMGLLLAVNRGAVQEAALIILEYRGNPKSKECTAVLGKGIIYDTGGLHLKQTGMETMKSDMAGGAAVFGVLQAAATLKLKVNLVGVIATAENAIGPMSFKAGDVYTSHSGKTVEIADTDAEGRLVLADALSYLQEHFRPTRIIDLATLTGGIVIALGEEMSGLFSNDDTLANHLIKAGEKTFERLWRMPLLPELKELLKSNIADIKNHSGNRKASSAVAAIFLDQFIKDISWAHLDIAGTAYLSEPKYYHTTHATGVGVRLLIEFLSKK